MAALKIALPYKALTIPIPESTALLFFLPLVPVLVLASLHLSPFHLESLMPLVCHAYTRFFEAPGLAFLLVNCLVVTIIASNKLESAEKWGHEKESSKRASMRELTQKGDEKGGLITENVTGRGVIGQSCEFSVAKGGHEEECKRESIREINKYDEKGAFNAKNVSRRGEMGNSFDSSLSAKGFYYHDMNEGEDFVGSSFSLINTTHIKPFNVGEKDEITRDCDVDKKKTILVNCSVNGEKKPFRRVCSLPCTGSENVKSTPLSDLKQKKINVRGTFSFNDRSRGSQGKATSETSQKPNDSNVAAPGRAGNNTDHPSLQPEEPATAAASNNSSLQDVWAAIMLTKRNDHYMPNGVKTADPSVQGSIHEYDDQAFSPAAARTPRATATDAPHLLAAALPTRPAAVAEVPCPRTARALRTPAKPMGEALSKDKAAVPNLTAAPVAATEKHEVDEDDRELEELNRRAEEFIARFNHQMRLQRQLELLQREARRTQHPSCNHQTQFSAHLQLPARGLLVG